MCIGLALKAFRAYNRSGCLKIEKSRFRFVNNQFKAGEATATRRHKRFRKENRPKAKQNIRHIR